MNLSGLKLCHYLLRYITPTKDDSISIAIHFKVERYDSIQFDALLSFIAINDFTVQNVFCYTPNLEASIILCFTNGPTNIKNY